MIPKAFRNAATDDDRRFLRKWTIGVAVAYGGLALLLISLAAISSNGPDATMRAEATTQMRSKAR